MSGLHLRHQCPQCGAPVDLQDTYRIFTCPFCQVRLFIHSQGPLSYALPPKIPSKKTLLYIPYWRFTGSIFLMTPRGIQYKILDSTLLALQAMAPPPSLGLRPQALRLAFAGHGASGNFLPAETTPKSFRKTLLHSVPGLDMPKGPVHTACVGDSISCIYLPVIADTGLKDAIRGTPFAHIDQREKATSAPLGQLQFLSTLCPQCGWDLNGETISLVHTCEHCETTWYIGPQGLKALTAHFYQPEFSPTLYLPFWNITVRSTGFALQSMADLMRLTDQPRIIQKKMEQSPCVLRLPAFKIRPQLFLHLGARTTLFPNFPATTTEPPKIPLHPVTLKAKDAFQALPILLGRLSPSKTRFFQRIQHGALKFINARLEYLPITERHKEYWQPELNMAIQKNALFWSTRL